MMNELAESIYTWFSREKFLWRCARLFAGSPPGLLETHRYIPVRSKVRERGRALPGSLPAFLEFLRQIDVNKPAGRIVGEVRVVGRGVGVGWIVTEDVIAAEGDARSVKETLPDLGRRSEAKSVGALNVEEPGLLYIMNKATVIMLVKTIEIVDGGRQIESMPGPIELGVRFPFQVTFIGASAAELALRNAGEISPLE